MHWIAYITFYLMGIITHYFIQEYQREKSYQERMDEIMKGGDDYEN